MHCIGFFVFTGLTAFNIIKYSIEYGILRFGFKNEVYVSRGFADHYRFQCVW